MKIKNQLILSAMASIILVALMFGILVFLFSKIDQAIDKNQAAGNMLKEVTELISVSDEYFTYHYERNLQQWDIKYKHVNEMCAANPSLFKTIQVDIISLAEAFQILQKTIENKKLITIKNFTEWDMQQSSILKERLQGRMRLHSNKIYAHTFNIFQNTMNRVRIIQKYLIFAFLLVAVLIIGMLVISSYVINRKITRPINTLIKGTTIIGDGNLDYQIPLTPDSSNEFEKLNRQFNKMAAKLSQSNQSLLLSQEKYQDLYDNAPDMFVSVDSKTGKILECNLTLANRLGYKKDEIIGRPIFDLYHTDSIEKAQDIFQKFLKTGKIIDTELELKDRDGNKIFVNLNVTAIYSASGEILASRSSWRDITDRKLLEKDLSESEQKYSVLYGASPDAVFMVDVETMRILDANEAAISLYGYTYEELMEMKATDVSEQAAETQRVLQKDLDTVVPMRYHRKKDGTVFPVEIISNFFSTKDRRTNISNIRDISQRIASDAEKKKLETQLRQSQKLESVGTLAGGIAHDFNNILSSIIGFTELILDDVEKGSPTEDHLQEVYNAGLRAKDLVGQILTFARQSDGNKKPVQVGLVAKEALKLIRSAIPTFIQIDQSIDSDSLVLADPTQLHQIFMNLCTNAAHSMETDGGRLHVSLKDKKISSPAVIHNVRLKPGQYIEICVSDNGVGILQENLDSIFEPYFTTKKTGEGTGLGLAVVHGIVKTCGGEIIVESELGKGTTFTIFLPTTKKYDSPKLDEPEILPTGIERILFIDDETTILKMGRQMLERLGYNVTIMDSSVEALALFSSKPNEFDIVISDMTMPNMTGDLLAIELMKIRPDISIIICTGYSTKISDEKAAKIGIKALAFKPLVKGDLAKTVRKVLDEAKGMTQQ